MSVTQYFETMSGMALRDVRVAEVYLVGNNGARTTGEHVPTGATIQGSKFKSIFGDVPEWRMDLPPNSEISPAGTKWARDLTGSGVNPSDDPIFFEVVVSGTAQNVNDHLTPAPTTVVDAGLPSHINAFHKDFITRPPGFGDRFYPALQEADSRLVRIGFMGDSTLCGLFIDDHDLALVGLARTWFQSRYGDGGSGWLDYFNSSLGGFGGPGGPNGGDTTLTGAWTQVPGGVNGNASRPTTAGSGATMTFHPRGTTLDIVSRVDPTFGRYDRQIDGGSVVQVPQNLTAAVQVNSVAVSPGAHTLVLTAAAGQCRLHGVRGRNATGVLVDNFSLGGRSIVSQGLGLDVAAEGLSGQTTLSTTFDVMPPLDLIVWQLGINDAVAAASPNYDTMWQILNNAQKEIRAAGINSTTPPEVVVMIPHISGFADSSAPYKFARIASILREWAASIGAGVVDMWAAGRYSGEYASGLNWFGFGLADVHLSAAGSAAYLAGLLSLIDPAQA